MQHKRETACQRSGFSGAAWSSPVRIVGQTLLCIQRLSRPMGICQTRRLARPANEVRGRTRFRAHKLTWLDMSCQLNKGVQVLRLIFVLPFTVRRSLRTLFAGSEMS